MQGTDYPFWTHGACSCFVAGRELLIRCRWRLFDPVTGDWQPAVAGRESSCLLPRQRLVQTYCAASRKLQEPAQDRLIRRGTWEQRNCLCFATPCILPEATSGNDVQRNCPCVLSAVRPRRYGFAKLTIPRDVMVGCESLIADSFSMLIQLLLSTWSTAAQLLLGASLVADRGLVLLPVVRYGLLPGHGLLDSGGELLITLQVCAAVRERHLVLLLVPAGCRCKSNEDTF